MRSGALHEDFAGLLQGLASSAAPLVQQFGLADPTGTARALLGIWVGSSQVKLESGVWFAGDRARALLLGKTVTAGMDVTAQDATVAAIEAAFAASRAGVGAAVDVGAADLRAGGGACDPRAMSSCCRWCRRC